jgi:hypothetical protein
MTESKPIQRGYTDTGITIIKYNPGCIILALMSNQNLSIVILCVVVGKAVQKQR